MNPSPERRYALPAKTLIPILLLLLSLPLSSSLLKSPTCEAQVRLYNLREDFFIHIHNHNQLLNIPELCNGFWNMIKSDLEFFSELYVFISFYDSIYSSLMTGLGVKPFLYSSVSHSWLVLRRPIRNTTWSTVAWSLKTTIGTSLGCAS